MENDLKIDHSFISIWHPRYDEIANDQAEYTSLVIITDTEIQEKGMLSQETFMRILNWKSPRVKGIIRLNDFSAYKETIRDACCAPDNEKLKILVQMHGIGAPVGSTILHFIYPSSFPIIDIRTAETLHRAGRIKSKSTDFLHYDLFRSEILNIAKENARFTLREIDRALFAYHKICLSSEIKKNNCHKSINREASMESFPAFVKRLSEGVACHYHKTSKAPAYSLKKNDTDVRGKMAVFAWVNELKRENSFRIDTYWYLADMAGVVDLADMIKDGMHFVSGKRDSEGKGRGISIFVQKGSRDEDYQKAVKVLKAVMLKK